MFYDNISLTNKEKLLKSIPKFEEERIFYFRNEKVNKKSFAIVNGKTQEMVMNGEALVIGIGFPILQSLGEKINLIKRILEVTPIGYLDVWVKQDIDINFIAKILIIVVVWSISTLSLSYIIFKRRDLK